MIAEAKRRVATYARVSTAEQSVDLQLDALRQHCELRGWVVVGEYVDHGVSGSKDRRPELDRMLADAKKRKFDVIAVWKLDRLARSVTHLLRMSEELEALGIDLCSCTELIDSTSSLGRFVFTILGGLAQFERDLIRERVIAGMKAARARGKKIGRPRLEPTEKEKQELLELRAKGLSIRKIAEQVSWFPANDGAARHPSPALVHRVLKGLSTEKPRPTPVDKIAENREQP